MRLLDFTVFPAISGEVACVRGTVADLTLAIPHLVVGGLIPPRPVLNALFERGEVDAGLSGGYRWAPFRISDEEFDELVAELSTRRGADGKAIRFERTPAWVTSRERWAVWHSHRRHGVPIVENLRRTEAMRSTAVAMERAAARGDERERVRLLVRLGEMATEWSAFVDGNGRAV